MGVSGCEGKPDRRGAPGRDHACRETVPRISGGNVIRGLPGSAAGVVLLRNPAAELARRRVSVASVAFRLHLPASHPGTGAE
eukprot:2747487-Rhodomonas_salina.2